MAWCPKCDGDYPIVTSVTGRSVGVPTVTQRYNWKDEYVGYEEGVAFKTDMQTVPRCSRCYSVFEFPNATSEEEYFYAKRQVVIADWHRSKPTAPGDSGTIWSLVITVFGAGIACAITYNVGNRISGNRPLVGWVAVAILIGVGILLWKRSRSFREKDDREEDRFNAETQRWRTKLEELQSTPYSHANYEKLKSGELFGRRELSEENRRLLSVFSEKRPMESLHRHKKK